MLDDDIKARLADIMQPILADLETALKQSTEKRKKADARRDALRDQHGDFVGDVLYYDELERERGDLP